MSAERPISLKMINYICLEGHVKNQYSFVKVDNSYINEMNGVLGHDFALLRLYWAGDNLG